MGTADNQLTFADYLSILRRRKWILILLPLVTGIAAFAITESGSPQYRAEAVVLLNRTNVVSGVTNTQDPSVFESTRFLTTQASIARSPRLAERVAKASKIPGLSAGAVLGGSSVTPEADSDLLKFAVTSAHPVRATTIANTYAVEFTKFKTELDTLKVDTALREIRGRMRTLESRGQQDGSAYQTLSQYLNQLLIGRYLLTNSASVLQPAGAASELGGTPQRNFVFGAFLGLVLAVGIAFLAEALDRKVRTEEELEEALGVPLLGRVSKPPDDAGKDSQLVMLGDPLGGYSETFRRLRANIEFVNLERDVRSIMFTSALPREGKSTTIANVAVAFARAGKRVVLVDLDVRLPTQHALFHVRSDHGIAEVVVGDDTLERAIQTIVIPTDVRREHAGNGARPRWTPASTPASRSLASAMATATNGPDSSVVLHLLVGGRVPPASGEFLNSERVTAILESLEQQFDLVLVDAPPLLAVSDAMALSAKVDGVVAVMHVGIQRPVLKEFTRQLENCPAPKLGFILTGTEQADGYGYGYGYGAPTTTTRSRAQERAR